MPYCEDYPCCGHTPGDPCPDRDRNGRIRVRCVVCNRIIPGRPSSSICARCVRRRAWDEDGDYLDRYDRD